MHSTCYLITFETLDAQWYAVVIFILHILKSPLLHLQCKSELNIEMSMDEVHHEPEFITELAG